MLKNKIVVRKIRNIVILLMAILIMIGAYKNIDRSRAENVIEINAITMDNYGCLENEEFTLEAKEISEGMYEIEIPETINTKQVNKVIEVTIESKTQGENTEKTETIEITDNKIYLTTEQIENNEIKFKTVYDVAITVIDEQGKYSKDLLSEMTEEEITEVKTMTNGDGLLYNRTLTYEENGKTIEVKGYMLDDVELDIQEVTREQISETYGEIQINSAYDIKTIRKIESQEEQGTTEIIEINPLEYGEIFEVSIIDSNIQKNSDVYYLKDEDTCNQVEINENTAGNIKFNMYYSGIYAVKQQHLSLFAESTTTENVSTEEESTVTTESETEEGSTEAATSTDNDYARSYFLQASGSWSHNVNSNNVSIGVQKTIGSSSDTNKKVEYVAWSTSTVTPTTWSLVEDVLDSTSGAYNYFSTTESGIWYLHVKTTDESTYYGGPYNFIQNDSYGAGVYANTTTPNTLNYGSSTVNVNATNGGTLTASSVRSKWRRLFSSEMDVIEEEFDNYTVRDATSISTSTRKHSVGIPDNIYNSDGTLKTRPEGEYYLAYKYWGATDLGASAIGYGRSTGISYFDKQGPAIRYSQINDYVPGIQGTLYKWYNTDVEAYLVISDGWSKVQSLEWSEDGEEWEILYDAGEVETGVYGENLSQTHTLTEERAFSNIYYRATDRAGNVGDIFTWEVGIDKTKPTVSVTLNAGSASASTYSKIKEITITAQDSLSGFGNGTEYKYCLLEEGTTPSSSTVWTTYANGATTTIGEGLTGKYYLYIKPVTDQAGNASSTDYHKFGLYYFDNKAPIITLQPESRTTWAKSHSVEIVITDEHTGLDAGLGMAYGWSSSNTEEPTTWESVTFPADLLRGDESTTVTINKSGITDKHYLWIIPGRIVDVLGNSLSSAERIISDGTYWFDNQAPTITLGAQKNETWAKTHNVTVTLADAHSGLAAGTSQSVKYGWSTSTSTEPSSYTTVSLTNAVGAANTIFTATTPSGLEANKYYLWVVPTTYKDKLGNQNSTTVKSTGTFWIDNTAPVITLGAQKNETWAKTHSVTVRLTDAHSGLSVGTSQSVKYGWSTSTSTEPSSYTTVSLTNAVGAANTTFTATTPSGLEANKYYLWVVPTTYKDVAGNQNSTPVKSTGTFWIDNTAPTITLSAQKNETWAKTHSVTVTLADAHSGLAAETSQSVKYGWSTSTSTEPSSYKTTLLTNAVGAENTTFTATTPSELATNKYYLWVVPTTYKDVAGNQNSTIVKSTGTFWIDNTAPTITLGAQKNETWAKTHSVTVTLADAHSGLAAGTSQSVKYGWSTSISTEPNSYTTVSLTNAVGAVNTIFTATTPSGLEANKYYLWVVPTTYKDVVGNQNSTTVKSTGTFWIDNTAPAITLGAQKNETWAKTHSVTVTLADTHSGLAVGTSQSVKYGWSTSTSTEPSSYTTASPTNAAGAANTTFTATTPSGLETNKYYLWIVPTTYKDVAGNQNSTTVKSTGTFWIDNTEPTITLSAQKNETWAKTHSVTVTLADAHSGLAAGLNQNIKYGWSLSNTEEPSTYTPVTLSNSEGAASTTFTAEGSGITGEYYLWVVPYSTNYVKDKLGNANTTPVKSTGTFYFDNQAPTEPILSSIHPSDNKIYYSGDWTNYLVRTTVSSTDEHSRIASIQFSKDKTNWSTISGELVQDGIKKSGMIEWDLLERDDFYYFKIVDNAGNEYISSSTMFNIKYDLTNPVWSYKDKEIYYSNLNDVGNEDYANRERTVKIIFEGTDAGGREVTSTLTAEDIEILVNGTPIQDQALSVKTLETVNNDSSNVTCTLTLKGILGDGDLTVSIQGETLTDKAGNKNGGQSLSTPIDIDNTSPEVTLTVTTPAGTYNADKNIIITAIYNENIYKEITSNTLITTKEDVNGELDAFGKPIVPVMTLAFEDGEGNKTPSKGKVSCIEVNGNILTYEYTIQAADNAEGTNGDNGTLIIEGLKNVYDAAGNVINEIQEEQKESNIIADTIHPTIISISPDKTSPTNAENITYTVEFSEPVTGFETDDITVNSGKGTVTSVSGSGEVYYVTITTKDNEEYTETITVAEGVCTDVAGNPNIGATSSEILVDRIDPTLTITADKESPTNAENITYTLTFSENVTGLEAEDIRVNSGKGTVTSFTGSGTTYTAIISTTDNAEYIETITIDDGIAIDKAGNTNAITTSAEIVVDRVEPTVTSITADKTSPTNAENITYTIRFNEDVIGFEAEDIRVNSGKGTVTSFTGSGTTYTAIVSTTDNIEYTETITINANTCTDKAGNKNIEKTSSEIVVDRIEPTVTSITVDKTSPTNAENITYIIEFSEPVIGLAAEGITVDSGKGTVTSLTGSGTTYTAIVSTTDDAEYTETITIAEGVCTDIAGNTNIEATSSEILVDRIDPTLTITADKESPTNAENIIYTLTFNENVTLSEVQKIITNSGEESIAVSGSEKTYIVTVPTTDNQTYTEKITVNVGTFIDKAGNGNIEAISSEILIDRIDPTITVEPISSTWTKSEISVEVTHNDEIGGSGIASTSGQYFLTTDDNPNSTGTLSNYTSGTAFTINPGVSGEYYLYIKEISDNAGNESNKSDNDVEINGVTYHKYGKYLFDYDKPIIEKVSSSKDSSNKTETIIFKVTDSLSGIANNLDVNNIIVKIDGESATAIAKPETSEQQEANKDSIWMEITSSQETSNETTYTLILSNFEQSTKIGGKMYKEWSGDVSIEIPANALQDNAGNNSEETSIDGEFVDYIKPVVEKVSAQNNVDGTNTQTIIFNVIDKYLDTSDLITLNENPELIVKVDGQEADITKTLSIVSKFVMNKDTKVVSSQANDYVVQSTEQVIGQQYKLVLSDFEKTRPSGKYYKEWSGDVSIEILQDAVKDTSENKNDEKIIDGKFADFIKPEFTYEYSETTIGDGNHTGDKTLTVVFYAADKHFDVANSSLQLSDLTVTVGGETIVVNNSEETDVNKKNTLTAENLADGTGIKYTLVIRNLEQDSNDGYSYSGTVSITIPEGKIKDTSTTPIPNSNDGKTITIGIDDPTTGDGHNSAVIVDVVSPVWKVVNSTTGTNAQGRTTAEIELIATDKYFSVVKNTREELEGLIEIQVAGIDISDEAEELTKTLSEPTYINWNSENETYTTVEEEQANGVKYTLTIENLEETYEAFLSARANNERVYREYSGPVKIVIPAGTVEDDYGNLNKIFEHDLNHIDTLRPEVVEISSSVDTTAKTQTIIFDITDKYLNTSLINPTGLYGVISAEDNADISKINTSYIDVYVDEELTKIDTDLDGILDTETITKTIKNIERLTATVGTNTNQLVGYRYTLELSGFEQSEINSKNYKDWSGTVSIKINANIATDTNTPTANGNSEKTIVGKYVDFVNPHIQYTHQESDIDKDGKKYTITFNVTDKYYDETTSQPFTVQDIQDGNIEILIQNGQKDSNGNAIIYNLKDVLTESSITLESAEIRATDVKITNTSGEIETKSNYLIGHTYILTISNLEEAFTGTNKTANYSGVITVALPSNRIFDRQGNKNDGKTITSIVHLPEGGTTNVVDVVRPIFDKVSSSANAVNGTATITFKGTDTYFVENSTLSADDIQVYVDGEVSNITKNISNPVYLKENRLQFGTNTTIQDVQYGVQYTLTLSGFAQNVNQVKIRIPEGKLTDQYGNFNVDTDLIVYNTLKLENMDEIDSVGLNTTEIDEAMDAILTKPFLGESTGTTIYPKNSTLTPIARQDIQQIQFVNNLDNLLEGEIPKIWDTTEKEWNIKTGIQRVWDISAQGDKSILAWTSQTQAPYTVYVGSAYEIFGNQNSRYLLAGIGKGTSATATTTVVNLNALNTSSVTNMYGMFYKFGYTAMTSLDLGNFDTSNVTNMYGIFSNLGYTKMASFDLGENFNTSKVTNMEMMFNKCGYKALLSLSLGDKFNTSNVRNMFSIFAYCGYTKMTALNLGNKFNTSNVTDMTNMFFGTGCMSMTNLYFGAESESTGVIILPDNFNTSNVKRMGSMFSGFGLFKITSLDLGNNFDTSNVTDMNEMFNSCGGMSMTNLELGEKFDTSKVTDMSGMFSACGTMAMTSFDLGEKFDTSKVTDMSGMFMAFGQKITSFNLGNKFDTSNVTDMYRMFYSFGAKLTSFDLGDKFYTSKVTDMNFMFAYVGNESMTKLDLGPHFTNIPDGTITVTNSNGTTSTHDAHDRMFGHCGKEGELTIYAPESIYSSSTTLKLNSTSEVTITPETLNTQNGEVIGTRGTIINPIYKPEWEVISTNAAEGTVTITVKGRAYENQTIDSNVAIKYAENVTSGLETGKVSIFIDDRDVTELTNPIVSEGITTTETVTVGTEQKTISIVTHTITLSNLDEADAIRITGIPYNEWAGKISLQIHGRGDDPSTYGANVLVDSNGNQNMMESIESGFVDFIKPEFRYESANTVIEGLPDIANQEDKEKTVKVVFDVLDKYYFGSTLSKDDITLKIIDPLPELTIDPEKISKELQLKTSDTETTDETSGLIYKTNGDIHFDIDGDGITERVGQRYELVIGNLDQGNGVTYSGPMSITFPAEKITDTSNNSNNATTITIGIDEIDGDPTTGDGGEPQIIDLVNPVWEIEGTPSVSTVNGITSASITLITYDKYLGESSLSGLKVLVAEEDKTTDLNLTVTDKTETIKTITREDGTTETVPAHKYTISFTNFEETYAKFLEERAKYIADSTTGRLYREFSGTVKIVVPKGSTVDMKGNDSEEFEIDLGTIDTLKPEIVKVSSSVNEDDKSQTLVFDITDKNLESSLITTSDTSKIHVLIENKEADVTKTITNITELKAMINNEEKTIGYRYTLKLTEFNKARTSAVYGEYTNWSGHVSIKIDEGTAKDANGSENEETILPAETIPTPEGENRPVDINASQEDFVDFIKPDITYIYSESSQAEAGDIDYSGKTFKMVFEITDKYFANSTLEINDLTIQIDGEEPDWRNPGETTGVTRNLTSIDVKDTIDGVSDAVIGKRYTLVLSDLEQLQIQNGDQYLDYSGVITVAIPEGKVTDSTGNDKDTKALANDGTTITSGIDIPGGAVGDKETVDVVDPLWQKVSSSANAINKTATIKIKGTDKFFENGVSLTSENIKSYIKVLAQTGTEGANATDITDSVNIEINDSLEQDVKATVNGVENVVVGKQYELTITGFEQNVNQIKIEIAEDTILDKSGNGNETTQLIVYNVLRLTNTETVESAMFIGSSGIERQNVEKVIFVDSLADAIEGKIPKIWDSTEKTWTYKSGIQKVWDVSAAQDDSILAWTSQTQAPYTVYIGSNFEMFANQDSSYLFAYIGYNSAKCTATETILYLDLLNTNSVINMSAMFSNTGYASMEKLNLGTLFNTTNVTKMNNMFENCGYTKMTNLYFGDENGETGEITFADSFDTSKVEDMSGMFKGFGYTKMQKLDLGNSFDTSNVKNMNNMFANCGYTLMTNLDLGNNFDTSNVEYMNNMFANCGHISMTTLDLSSGTGETNTTQFNTIKVKEMSGMFNSTGYELMTSLNLGNNFDTRNVIKMVSMFEKCGYTEMQSLDLGNKFYTTKVDDMSNMFNSCGAGKMEILDLGPLFTRIAETYENMFKDCGTTELKIYAPESIYSNRTTFK